MALVHIQSMLAKIYTDSQLRQRFLLNPYDVATEYNLEDSEIEQIIGLSKDQVETFAMSLIYKRLGEIRKKLFFTSRVLGMKFPRIFFQYAKESSPQGIKKHLKDTYLFAKYIKRVAVKEEVAPWVLEIMQYEINGMKTFLSSFSLSVSVFHYDIPALIDAVLKDVRFQPKKRIRLALCLKSPLSRKIYQRIF